ncbi:MAG TPA: PEGA domain-containing protein [Rubricoccaceae bacterium]
MRLFSVVCLCLLASGARAQDGSVLRIESEPAGARVVLDDIALVGQPTPLEVPVLAGVHRVRVLLDGYAPYEETVTVNAGVRVVVVARLQQPSGRLAFDSLPPGATVTVGGQPYRAGTRLPVGSAEVTVSIPGQRTLTATVPVSAERETAVRYGGRQFRAGRAMTALVAPGLVQLRDGRRGVGTAYAATIVGGLAAAGVLTFRAAQAVGDTAAAQARYDAATSEPDAVAAREDLTRLVNTVRTSRQARGGTFVALGVVYAASVVDAFVRHVGAPVLVSRLREFSSVRLHVRGGEAGLALRF